MRARLQGPKAEKLLAAGMERGLWVCWENCHLSTSWMPTLEGILQTIWQGGGGGAGAVLHKDFRLWLTSMPSAAFPVLILQNSIKLTVEPPKGLRANLARLYSRHNDLYLNSVRNRPNEWKRLLWAMSMFHGVLQVYPQGGPRKPLRLLSIACELS
jgi:dynein heavy chain